MNEEFYAMGFDQGILLVLFVLLLSGVIHSVCFPIGEFLAGALARIYVRANKE